MIIGLDVGGTHTDVVLIGNEGLIRSVKVPTRSEDLFHTVLTGLEEITADIDLKKITRMVLSTTLTTNAIAQRNIPRIGMIVSAGPGIDPEFFRTHDDFYPVAGAMDHRGRETQAINAREIKQIAGRFQETGIRHVGVVGKFSVRNPAHELEIQNLLGDGFEKVFLGHRFSGNLNFPRRIATTYLNAAVYPIHREFFQAVANSLEKKGLSVPIRILKADGGNMNFRASIDFPGQTILSGPAASVMGSIGFAPTEAESLSLDIGGTTTDMTILINRAPLLDPLGIELGGYKTLIRSLETHSVGIGGDSAVTVKDGRLRIGPERLGPAMAYGGPAPTPTDAIMVLEQIREADRDRSIKGVEAIAKRLDLTVEEAATEIFDTTCRRILSEVRRMIDRINSKPVYTVHEILDGFTVNPKKMLVLGGPAPHFAKRLEALSDYTVEVVPRWSVANAIGAALARTTAEVILYADTEQGIATAPEENFKKTVGGSFTKADAVQMALALLKEKALKRGANPEHLEMETTEEMAFNMVRGFSTTGKNIRVKVQIKPGLIHGHESVTADGG